MPGLMQVIGSLAGANRTEGGYVWEKDSPESKPPNGAIKITEDTYWVPERVVHPTADRIFMLGQTQRDVEERNKDFTRQLAGSSLASRLEKERVKGSLAGTYGDYKYGQNVNKKKSELDINALQTRIDETMNNIKNSKVLTDAQVDSIRSTIERAKEELDMKKSLNKATIEEINTNIYKILEGVKNENARLMLEKELNKLKSDLMRAQTEQLKTETETARDLLPYKKAELDAKTKQTLVETQNMSDLFPYQRDEMAARTKLYGSQSDLYDERVNLEKLNTAKQKTQLDLLNQVYGGNKPNAKKGVYNETFTSPITNALLTPLVTNYTATGRPSYKDVHPLYGIDSLAKALTEMNEEQKLKLGSGSITNTYGLESVPNSSGESSQGGSFIDSITDFIRKVYDLEKRYGLKQW